MKVPPFRQGQSDIEAAGGAEAGRNNVVVLDHALWQTHTGNNARSSTDVTMKVLHFCTKHYVSLSTVSICKHYPAMGTSYLE